MLACFQTRPKLKKKKVRSYLAEETDRFAVDEEGERGSGFRLVGGAVDPDLLVHLVGLVDWREIGGRLRDFWGP